MKNLASREYNHEYDKEVRDELKAAGIPAVRLDRMEGEVKTHYIGILNGFVFTRAWYYWVVRGWMPLEQAQNLYKHYKDLNIRVDGDAGNPAPEDYSHCKDSDKIAQDLFNQYKNGEKTMDDINAEYLKLSKQGDQFIDTYHIDTQEGLNKFAEAIRSYNIQSDIIEG